MPLPAQILDEAVDSGREDAEPGGGCRGLLLAVGLVAVLACLSWSFRAQPDHIADGAELDPVPRAGKCGFGAAEVPHLRSGAADQLPASRRLSRVDGRVVPGQRHRSCRNSGARGAPARNLQRLVFAHHVPEAGCEAREGNGPDLAGVGCDDTVGTEAGQLPHFGEILAVVHGVNDHQAAGLLRRCREVQLQEGLPDPPGGGRRFGPDHDGFGGGQDILLARQRILEERGLQGEHVLRSG